MPCKVGIIADDLTGANDAGVQFRKYGLTTVCHVGVPQHNMLPEAEVIVVDTESRDKPRDEARKLAGQAAAALKDMGATLFYKKIDSTMRGNIGVETEAIMDTLGINTTILTPSYPANGRVVIEGSLLVHGTPLQEAGYLAGVQAGRWTLQTLLGRSTTRRVTHITLETVSQGYKKIATEIAQKTPTEGNIFTLDAASRRDLTEIARAACEMGMTLLCGSAGLAEEIPYAYNLIRSRGPVLAVVGSPNPTSIKQLDEARRMPNIATVDLDASKLILEGIGGIELRRAADELLCLLSKGIDSVLTSVESKEHAESSLKLGLREGFTEVETRARIAQCLSDIVAKVIERSSISGLFVTGGETAIRIIEGLQAAGTEIVREVSPGMPVAKILGGRFAGLRIVTKAGGFGDDYSLIDAIRYLKSRGDPD
jgi:uncharacterized protein YgbK (DUF1537 family)